MSETNRERRKAKQQARSHFSRPRSFGADSGGFGFRTRPSATPDPELILTLLHDASRATGDGDTVTAALYLDGLVELPDLAVDRQVRFVLATIIEITWGNGWQPADLVHQLRRRFGSRAVALLVDSIAAAMRRYSATTVDPQWTRQLSALEADVWWTDDDSWLTMRAGRDGMQRELLLTCAIEAMAALSALPPVQMLCQPPGRATNVPAAEPVSAGSADGAQERILRKVRALLAKAESTDFPEEAETLSAQAQQLIAKYSIDAALLAADAAGAVTPIGRRIGIDSPYESPKVSLLNAVAAANRCRAVWHKQHAMVSVLGFPADLDAVELLFTSLLVQATGAMTRAGSRTDARGRTRTRSFRQSFLTAYAYRIGERLREATEEVTAEASEQMTASTGRSLLPVLAARSEAVDKAVDELFTKLVPTAAPSVTNAEGWRAGRAAADLATLQHRSAVKP